MILLLYFPEAKWDILCLFVHVSVVIREIGLSKASGIWAVVEGTLHQVTVRSPLILKFCESAKSIVCFLNLPKRMSGKNLGFCQKDKGSVIGTTT